ncbi:apolipoprotein D-like isoform X2 [Paramacrobiotus metropolitanus]|uniref:apolipoprotein D-like isoform X2 n=1 Tax=Paramacrobiotus metropolitanus TaxID=2943436 RepID=UPI002445628E|nr:apolipoprotein D-like isoform X2 [Paramacrobiotus metropolitanus]
MVKFNSSIPTLLARYCLVTFVMSVIARISAQIPSWGSCPTVDTVADFDINRYLGKWFEIEAYFHFFELGLTCITADYSLSSVSSVQSGLESRPMIVVRNSGWNWIYGNEVVTLGEAYAPDPIHDPGKMKIRFPNVTAGFVPVMDTDYWILDTDYTSYAVVWSCTSMDIFGASFMNAQSLWVLSRTPELSPDRLQRIKTWLTRLGINSAGLMRPSTETCPGRKDFNGTTSKINNIFFGNGGTQSNDVAVRSLLHSSLSTLPNSMMPLHPPSQWQTPQSHNMVDIFPKPRNMEIGPLNFLTNLKERTSGFRSSKNVRTAQVATSIRIKPFRSGRTQRNSYSNRP